MLLDGEELLLKLFNLLVLESDVLSQTAYQSLQLVLMHLLDIALLLQALVLLSETLVPVLEMGHLLVQTFELSIHGVSIANELLVLIDYELYNNLRQALTADLKDFLEVALTVFQLIDEVVDLLDGVVSHAALSAREEGHCEVLLELVYELLEIVEVIAATLSWPHWIV